MTEEIASTETTTTKDEKKTPEENLAKMKSILANLKAKRGRISIAIKKAAIRHANAKVDILVRRFAFDLKQLREHAEEVDGQIQWTQNMVDYFANTIEKGKHTSPEGELIHRPFAALGALLK